MKKINLLDLSKNELTALLAEHGQKKFRAKQIWQWLYRQYVADVGEMVNLPKSLRAKLADFATIYTPTPVAAMESSDGNTFKTLFRFGDNEEIEVVLMKYDKRRTLCISTQAG